MSIESKQRRGRPKRYTPTARQVAKAAGQLRYFDSIPCARGHISERYTSNAGCIACHLEKRGHPFTGSRVNPGLLKVIRLAENSEARQLENLKQKIICLQNNAKKKYAELRMALTQTQEI